MTDTEYIKLFNDREAYKSLSSDDKVTTFHKVMEIVVKQSEGKNIEEIEEIFEFALPMFFRACIDSVFRPELGSLENNIACMKRVFDDAGNNASGKAAPKGFTDIVEKIIKRAYLKAFRGN